MSKNLDKNSKKCSLNVKMDNALIEMEKSIELNKDLFDKLADLPQVVLFIERLQNMIRKQVKKIIKWKMRVKELSNKEKTQLINVSTQTSASESQNNCPNKSETDQSSLTENIREAAEEAVRSSGFVYEETSGLYYDYNSGYYYNAECGLYYDGTTGKYLKYNQETQTYEFHSQVEPAAKKRIKKHSKEDVRSFKRKRKNSIIEDGECSESSEMSSQEGDELCATEDTAKNYPPCIRIIVKSTEIPKLKTGSLFLITCDGGTVGRETDKNHSISLNDINVSKHHLKISYNSQLSIYEVIDLGSRNGTFLNGKRLSNSKQESEPVEILHASKLQVGSTIFLCHIHEGSQTCGQCEPGLLIVEEKEVPSAVLHHQIDGKTINEKFRSELKRLRKTHGFLGSHQETPKIAEGYIDRAEKRRAEVGSQNPYEKTETASVDESIPAENKGFKLLAKMGWKEGDALGKDGTGVKEPVKVVGNCGTSGMGVSTASSAFSTTTKNENNIWKKTQERFEKLPQESITNISDEDL